MSGQPSFGVLLERFFTQRLMQQRRASAHTIASYRDTFKMLLQFVHQRLRKAPSALALDDIDAPLVMAFLDEMERVRGITARTRNLRLTAVHRSSASPPSRRRRTRRTSSACWPSRPSDSRARWCPS